MKKPKGQTVDLLYINKEKTNKQKNKKTNKQNNKKTNKQTNKKRNNKTKRKTTNAKKDNEIINLDNEIIIGLTPKKEEEKISKNKKTTKKKNTSKKKKSKPTKVQNVRNKKSNTKNKKQKKEVNFKIVKWITIIILFTAVVILFMMSSIFNIRQIVVINNNKVSSEEIISLSKLTTDVSMFKTTNNTIRNNIKQNAYIENVKIKRNINGTVTLDVKERKPTYMLQFENRYVYINNQGYILEVSENQLEIPIIIGFSTPEEEIEIGNRINVADLNELDSIIKIMETVKNSSLENKVTKIDISDVNDCILTVASEGKTIKLSNLSNLNIKLQMAGQVIEREKGKTGEIYFQEEGKKAIFKEEVSR